MKYLILISCIVASCSCTYTLHPDGSESYSADPLVIARAIEVLAEK
jgi:hypothetical protein